MRLSTLWITGWATLSLAAPLTVNDDSSSRKNLGAQIPRLATYVQSFNTLTNGNLSMLPIRDQQTHITHMILAALHIESQPGLIHLNDNDIDSPYWDVIWAEAALIQAAGTKVMMMIGGAAQGSYQRLCSGNGEGNPNIINEVYYLPLQKTLLRHKIDGIDLDIEEVVPLACPLALLRRLNADFGKDFILTMAPVASDLQPSGFGLGGFSYPKLDAQALSPDKANGKLVDWYNVQFYNGWGDASSPAGYASIINNGFKPSRVVMGILDSPEDGGSGWYPQNVYTGAISQLIASYPTFGGVVSWEYHDSGFGDEQGDNIDSAGFRVRGQGVFHDDPWVWQKQIAQTLTQIPGFGVTNVNNTAHSGKTPVFEDVGPPHPKFVTPWPDAFNTLTSLGVPGINAVWALNITSGNLTAAAGVVLSTVDSIVEATLVSLAQDVDHALGKLLS